MTLQYEGYKQIKYIRDKVQELEKLKIEYDSEVDKEKSKKIKEMIDHHVETLDDNGLIALLDAGMYGQLVEEVVLENATPNGVLSKYWMKAKEESPIPGFVFDGAEMLFVSNTTKMYKLIHGLMQYGDFISRYAMYRMAMAKAKRVFKKKYKRAPNVMEVGKMQKRIISEVRRVFVLYSVPDDSKTDWLNRHAVIKFSKYKTRIQNIAHKMVKRNPIRNASMLLFEDMLGLDIPSIVDSTFLDNPGFYNPGLHGYLESMTVPAVLNY